MIAIYYIATDQYTQYADGFIETVKYFWPQQEKTIVLIGTEELQKYEGERNGMKLVYHKENGYPWPIISMYKFYTMKRYKVEGADYHFMFNANILFNQHDFDWSWFEGDEIKCTQHAAYDINDYSYVQSGCLCIPNTVFDTFCDEHIRRINHYMQKEFIVPKWHDETVVNEMLIRDKFLPYKIFPDNVGLRWDWFNGSPTPKQGLCFLIDKNFQKKFKGW